MTSAAWGKIFPVALLQSARARDRIATDHRSRTADARLSQRHLPDGRSSRRPRDLLGRTAQAGDPAAGRLPPLPLTGADAAARALFGHLQRRFRRCHGSLRRAQNGQGEQRRELDQPPHRRELLPAPRTRRGALAGMLAGRRTRHPPPGRRALRRRLRPGVLRRIHVQPRAGRLESGAGLAGGSAAPRRGRTARLPVHHLAPRLAGRGRDQPAALRRTAARGAEALFGCGRWHDGWCA